MCQRMATTVLFDSLGLPQSDVTTCSVSLDIKEKWFLFGLSPVFSPTSRRVWL